jgi:hypothetical protein
MDTRGKRRYKRLKATGMCASCAKTPAATGKTLCEKCVEAHKEFYKQSKKSKDFRQKRAANLKEWVRDNQDYSRQRNRSYIKRRRDEVFTRYGGECVCCGENEFVFLTLDHVHNDGKEERERWGSGTQFYRAVKKRGYPKTLQLLCHNCNQAMRINGFCPHRPEQPRRHVWFAGVCSNCRAAKTEANGVCVPQEFTPKRHDTRCLCLECESQRD